MTPPSNATLAERTERVVGVVAPKPPSRFWLASFPMLVAVGVDAILWPVLSGARKSRGLPDGGRVLLVDVGPCRNRRVVPLHPSRGAVGQGSACLRVGGVRAPLDGMYALWFWSTSSRLGFAVMSALLGVWVVGVASRLTRLAGRGG